MSEGMKTVSTDLERHLSSIHDKKHRDCSRPVSFYLRRERQWLPLRVE
jgi:hypothetical protein